MNWVSDKAWSDRYIGTIKTLVGPYLLCESSFEQDTKQASDLIVLRGRDTMIAARVRRPGFAERYPNQFTIRSHRNSGATTELEKIVNGFGDWMFYGHASPHDFDSIAPWWIIDLSAFRAQLIRNRTEIQFGQQPNGDGTAFTWFNIATFRSKPPLLIAEAPF